MYKGGKWTHLGGSVLQGVEFCVWISFSYFPNGDYSLGVSILQDVEGQIQKLRDEAVRSL